MRPRESDYHPERALSQDRLHRSADLVHHPDKLGAPPFDLVAVAIRHLLQRLTDSSALRGQRERLFDLARHPFLAPNQQGETSAYIADARNLGREWSSRR